MANDNTFLQAFGAGSSLADKARNYQLSLAHLALQQEQQSVASQQAALALQTHGYALQHQKEQDAFLSEDLPKVQDWQKQYLQWNAKGDPTAPFPEPPSDLKSITALKTVGDMTGPVIQNLPMAQNRFYQKQAYDSQMEQLNQAQKVLNEEGQHQVILDNSGGLDQNGRIDPAKSKAIFDAAAPILLTRKKEKDAMQAALFGSRLAAGSTVPEGASVPGGQTSVAQAAVKTAGGVQGQKAENAVKTLQAEGRISNDPNEAQAVKTAYEQGKASPPNDLIKTFNNSDVAITGLNRAFSLIKDFNQKYGSTNHPDAFGDYIGPIDKPKFTLTGKWKGLTTQEQLDAKDALTQIKGVVDTYRKGLYGSALTPTEQKEFADLIGSANNNDYVNSVSSFVKTLKTANSRIIHLYPYAQDFNLDTIKTYAPDLIKSGTPPAANSGSSLPSGWSFTK
jgi:hypothetical protein